MPKTDESKKDTKYWKNFERSFYKKLGDRCKAIRIARGFSANEAARLTGMSQGHVSEFESGIKRMNLARIARLAHLYEVTLGQMMSDTEKAL